MRNLITVLTTLSVLLLFNAIGLGQEPPVEDTPALQPAEKSSAVENSLQLDTNRNTIQSQAAPTLGANDSESVSKKDEVDPAVALYNSLIFSARTKNGYTIYGIPMKPEVLPVNLFGAEAKIPWSSIRSVRFAEDGSTSISLDDGSNLKGFSAIQQLTLDKKWGSITVFRDKLESITREVGRKSTEQSTFRTPGVPYRVNPQARQRPFPQRNIKQPSIQQGVR